MLTATPFIVEYTTQFIDNMTLIVENITYSKNSQYAKSQKRRGLPQIFYY
jgi:hypothetical protein